MKHVTILFSLTLMAGSSLANEMPQSATEMGCPNCHALDARVVGPSWAEVAQRYRAKRYDPDVLEKIIKNISNGSRDNWGNLPMIASDPTGKKRGQIVEIVRYILSLPEEPPTPPGASQPIAASAGKGSKIPK